MKKLILYRDIIKHIEEKYKIQTRDYLHLFGGLGEAHFEKYCRVANDPAPTGDPDMSGSHPGKWMVVRNGQKIPATEQEYDADFKLTHEHYQRYTTWEKTNPAPEYLDYWHWILEEIFDMDVRNPCTRTLPVLTIIQGNAPEWVKKITQMIHDEYKDSLSKKGALRVRIAW